MTYSCIDAYEAIMIDLCKHDPELDRRFADSEDGEDQARAAQWMLDSIQKIRTDRAALLAALKTLANWSGGHGMNPAHTAEMAKAREIIAQVEPATL